MPIRNPADRTGFGRLAIRGRLSESRIRSMFGSVAPDKGA